MRNEYLRQPYVTESHPHTLGVHIDPSDADRRRTIITILGIDLSRDRMRRPVEYRRHIEQTPEVVRQRLRDAIDRGAFVPARRQDAADRRSLVRSMQIGSPCACTTRIS